MDRIDLPSHRRPMSLVSFLSGAFLATVAGMNTVAQLLVEMPGLFVTAGVVITIALCRAFVKDHGVIVDAATNFGLAIVSYLLPRLGEDFGELFGLVGQPLQPETIEFLQVVRWPGFIAFLGYSAFLIQTQLKSAAQEKKKSPL